MAISRQKERGQCQQFKKRVHTPRGHRIPTPCAHRTSPLMRAFPRLLIAADQSRASTVDATYGPPSILTTDQASVGCRHQAVDPSHTPLNVVIEQQLEVFGAWAAVYDIDRP